MELIKIIDDYIEINKCMPGDSEYWRERFSKAYTIDKVNSQINNREKITETEWSEIINEFDKTNYISYDESKILLDIINARWERT